MIDINLPSLLVILSSLQIPPSLDIAKRGFCNDYLLRFDTTSEGHRVILGQGHFGQVSSAVLFERHHVAVKIIQRKYKSVEVLQKKIDEAERDGVPNDVLFDEKKKTEFEMDAFQKEKRFVQLAMRFDQ